MESRKRKREDYPRITYHAEERTFDRLFKEETLWETKEVVRQKLGLTSGEDVQLAQLRAGLTIDLEDDDDFDAFYALAATTSTLDVQVTVIRSNRINGASRLPEQTGSGHHSAYGSRRYQQPLAEDTLNQPGTTSRRLTPVQDADMQVERNIGIEGSSKPPMTPRKRKVSFVDVPQAAPSEIPNAKEKKRKSNSGSVMATKSSKPPSNVSALHGGPSGSKEPALNLQEGHIEESGLAGEGSVPAGQPEAPAKVTRKTIKLRNSYTGNLAADSNLPLHDTADTPPVIGASTSPSDANEKNPPTKKPASKRSNLSLGPNAKKRVVASRQTAKSVSTQEPIDRVDEATGDPTAESTFPSQPPDPPIGKKTKNKKGQTQQEQANVTSVSSSPNIPSNDPAPKKGQKDGPSVPSAVNDQMKRSTGKKKTGENADGEVSKDLHEANHGTGVSKKTTISKNKKTIVVNEDLVAAVRVLVSLAPTANDQVPRASSSATPNYEDDVVCDEVGVGSEVQAKRPATRSKLSSSSGIDNSQELPATAGSDKTVSAPFSKKSADLSTRRSNLVPCPVCLRSPLHVRYRCPIIVAGHDSIRERLHELREEHSGRNVQLIEELEHILKGGGVGGTEKSNVNPNSSVLPSTSTPPMKQILSKQVLVDNNSNAPKPGSTAMPISENVDSLRPPGSNPAVNTPGEHSSSEDSDEGSSENDRDEGFDSSKRPERLATTTFPNPSSYASIDLDALINPPSSRDIDKILEIEDHEEEEEEIVLEEEEDDLKFRRHSMGLRTAESSSDEDQASDLPVGADEGNESNASPPAEEGQAQLASPRDLSPSEVHTSFQDINGLGESLETDRRGDAAFSDALAADKAAINLAQASEDDTEVAQSTDETDVSVGKTSLRRQAREGKQKTVQREQGSRDDRVGNVRADKLRNRTEVVTAPDQSGLLQHEDVAEIVTDTTLADNENLHVRQPIVTSSSMGTIRQTPQNQRLEEDPIESTDSFLDDPVQPKTNGLNSVQRERSPSPTRSAPKVVMVKRMKNRSGMVPSTDADVPVPKTDPKAANGSTTATAVPQTIDTQEPGGQIVAKRTRAAGRIVPAPLASVPDTTPKPKGRGHKKTEEEKTFEAAQKLAAKKEKAKLREEKAQAKKQEKARLKEEKGRLQREKAEEKKTVTKKKTGAKPLSVSVEPSATSSGKNLPLPAPSTPPRNDSRSLWPPSSQPQWAALSQSPSAPDRDSPDQLLSSPRGKGTADPLSKEKSPGPNHSDQEDPLFVLTESQVPFPYSQFRSQEEDREEPVTNKKMQRARVNSASSYRRLTDIASQQGLFPVPSLTQSSPVRSVIRNKYHEMDDEDDDEDEDEEDDSGSDSGAEKSHIPLSRRAGVSV